MSASSPANAPLRADRLLEGALRAVGVLVWLVVGTPSWTRLASAPEAIGGGHAAWWCVAYVAFAPAFLGATSPRPAMRSRRILLALQSFLALALACLGMPHFEGALFALVAAQAPALFSPGVALAWDVAQGAALVPFVLPSHGPLGSAKAVAEYAVFALFALAVLVLRQREAAARRELAQAHAALLATQSLLADDARNRERARLAREVHDAIGHGLTAASLHLQIAARAGGAAEPIAAAREAVSATLVGVRELVRTARDELTVDLATALRALCVGIDAPRVHLTFAPAVRALDPARAHVAFRCVQEALTNAIRHADATNLWIDVQQRDGLSILVRDDGVGRDVVELGCGLDGARERLAEAGGTLVIETRRGAGFTVRAELPRREGDP